ncbi:MAG: universal stress protein [Geodermatophilales bacterium]|nr:universal stress protein [Geodermatophilales bacterium]
MGAARDRVVVGVDGSAWARAALDWALTEAARRGATVEVISAFPVDSPHCVMHAPCPVLVVHDRPDGSTDPQAHSVEAAAPVAG